MKRVIPGSMVNAFDTTVLRPGIVCVDNKGVGSLWFSVSAQTQALSGFSAASTSIRMLLSSVCPVITARCTSLQLKIQKGINSLVWHQPVSFQNTSAPSGASPSSRFHQAPHASVPLEQSPMQSLVSSSSCVGGLSMRSRLHQVLWLGWSLLKAFSI